MKRLMIYLVFFVCVVSCRSQKPVVVVDNSVPVAFPGAEGFGKYTTGGRGGKVFVVSNLADSGPGSFREAADAKVPRIIVFAVSGTIHLKTELRIRGDVSIFGQTAPGGGICFADRSVILGGNNIIVQYLRFRLGDRYQNTGKVPGAGHDDAFTATNRKHLVIDHCSFSWSTDETFSVYSGDSVTVQWNILAEPLNYSYHFEKGDTDFERHGYGGIWGGRHLTAHHNLIAHCISRTPRFSGARYGNDELVDYTNNVIYNWESNNVYGGEGGRYNVVNNYYKYGPATKKNVASRIVNPTQQAEPFIDYGKFYVSGNYVDGAPEVSRDNTLGVHMGNNGDKSKALVSNPIDVFRVPVVSAEQAYREVLERAGASFIRDSIDARIVSEVQSRTGKIIDVQGGHPHGTSYDVSFTAWPKLQSGSALADSDGDGMPDAWEKEKGLDPKTPDASNKKLHSFYTNIEVYVHSLTSNSRK